MYNVFYSSDAKAQLKALLVFISDYSRKMPKYAYLSVCKCSVRVIKVTILVSLSIKRHDFNLYFPQPDFADAIHKKT